MKKYYYTHKLLNGITLSLTKYYTYTQITLTVSVPQIKTLYNFIMPILDYFHVIKQEEIIHNKLYFTTFYILDNYYLEEFKTILSHQGFNLKNKKE